MPCLMAMPVVVVIKTVIGVSDQFNFVDSRSKQWQAYQLRKDAVTEKRQESSICLVLAISKFIGRTLIS
jgi:hypothetical protein